MTKQIKKRPGTITGLTFRRAAMGDADLLLEWRNDSETRRQSHNASAVSYDDHAVWLKASLLNPHRELRIAELDGLPVGTIRVDKTGDVYALSWTVAPDMRGRGIGKAMLKATMDALDMPVCTEIKSGNEASKRMAEYAGMTLEREENGILYYRK